MKAWRLPGGRGKGTEEDAQGLNLGPLHWVHGVLVPGPPEKSHDHLFLLDPGVLLKSGLSLGEDQYLAQGKLKGTCSTLHTHPSGIYSVGGAVRSASHSLSY